MEVRNRLQQQPSALRAEPPATAGAPAASLTLTTHDLEPFRRHRVRAKRYLPFLRTLNDFDIASEVGFHELSGTPLTVKQLLLLELAPPVTVFRRLNRLCDLGIIVRTRSLRDRRVHELRFAPAVHRLFAMYSHDGEP
jgi:hypothetical protein